MKTQRRTVDDCRQTGEYAAQGWGIARLCVALVTALLAACLQSLSRTASPGKRQTRRAAFMLLRSLPTLAGIATTSLLQTGYCQKLSRYARRIRRVVSPASSAHASISRNEPMALSLFARPSAAADGMPENSPPLVRVSPQLRALPVVLAACPRTERQHGQGDLYFQHAA